MSDEKVNLNQADIPELAALPGIGVKLATKIIEYREERQPFSDVAELAAVPGISEQLVTDIGDRLTVGESDEIEEKSESRMDVGPPDEQALPSLEGETTTIIRVSPEGEATLIVDTAPETIQGAGPEVESTRQEEISSPTEGGVLPEEEVAAEAETEPEMPEMEEVPAALEDLETESDVEPVSESEIILEPDLGETELGEESVAETPTPVEVGTQPTINAGYILSALAGAFLGAVLVLIFLLLVNRTLRFAGDTSTNDLQEEYDQEIKILSQGQTDLWADNNARSNKLENLNSQLETVTAAQGALTESIKDLDADLVTLEEGMQTLNDFLTDMSDTNTVLEEDLVKLEERFNVIAESAENFEPFLDGLRDLLITLQGPSPTPTATIPATGSPSVTITPTPTVTVMPTRTPRPTATPLSIPSPTINP